MGERVKRKKECVYMEDRHPMDCRYAQVDCVGLLHQRKHIWYYADNSWSRVLRVKTPLIVFLRMSTAIGLLTHPFMPTS